MTVSPASGKEIHPRLPWVEIARLLAPLVVIMQHVPSMGFPPNQWLIGPALATFFLLERVRGCPVSMGGGKTKHQAGSQQRRGKG